MFRCVVQEGSVPVGSKGYHKQAVYIYLYGENGKPLPFPEKFEKLHDKDTKPLPPGEMMIAPHSFVASVDERGNKGLRLGRMHLVSIPQGK